MPSQAHTCCYQDAPLARLELVEGSQPLWLAHLAMDGQGIKAQVPQHEGQLAGIVAGPCKDHESGASQLIHIVHQVTVLQGLNAQDSKNRLLHLAPVVGASAAALRKCRKWPTSVSPA